MKILFIFLHFLLTCKISDSTLSQSDKKVKKKSAGGSVETKSGPIDLTVYSKSLVTSKISGKQDILDHYANYHQDTQLNNFDGQVLGYVTPWNSHGYDVAKIFSGSKLNMISPVWLQVIPEAETYRQKSRLKILFSKLKITTNFRKIVRFF